MRIATLVLSLLTVFAFSAASTYADMLPRPKPRIQNPASQSQERPQLNFFGQRVNQQRMPLHGNTESKIYHASDCEYYNSKAATAEFSTAHQAENAGFRACKVCEGKEGVATVKKQQRQQQPNARNQLHGNPDSKTLHGPSCKFYNAKSSSERFSSADQARAQGYHLCTLCGGK